MTEKNFENNTLYREVIMEHYKHPQNKGLKPNLRSFSIKNPVCGDSVSVQIEIDDEGKIKNIFHKSIGCSISTSSSSIMSTILKGKTIAEAQYFIENFVKMVKGEPFDKGLDFGDAIAYEEIYNYPARFKCVSISWEIVSIALREMLNAK